MRCIWNERAGAAEGGPAPFAKSQPTGDSCASSSSEEVASQSTAITSNAGGGPRQRLWRDRPVREREWTAVSPSWEGGPKSLEHPEAGESLSCHGSNYEVPSGSFGRRNGHQKDPVMMTGQDSQLPDLGGKMSTGH